MSCTKKDCAFKGTNTDTCDYIRRSPHGERGLKFQFVNPSTVALQSLPHGERGLK